MTPAARVFLSYARRDGEEFAARLRQRLEAEAVPLWRDREGMEGGRDWWQQITAALDQVEFMLLVITPAAVQSDIVRREWRYARQRGVTVYPVLAEQAIDFAALPRWMRAVHFYDPAHEWRKLVSDLHTRPQRVRVPFMVEDLPPDFVPRPREHELLLNRLLDRSREEPVAITTALRGAGGFGKTALARALCHDERIQNAFDDGVLWVTLGEKPGELTARVEDLIFMLSGQRPGFASTEAAVAALTELLADREVLIVIDDVWQAAHARPFLQGGERCARIITTRNSDTLPPGAARIEVDAMAEAEALALLGHGLPAAPKGALPALARRLGEWPLLLKLVNAALRERVAHQHQPIDAALAYVNKALDKRGLTFFDAHDAVARHAAVTTTLGVSFAQLTAPELQRLEDLAVFPEDVDIPLATLTHYWAASAGLDEFDTEALCERLARLSLLLSFDPPARHIRLHAVGRRLLIERSGAHLPALHALLLDSLRPAGASWAALPSDEAYAWQWVFMHLLASGREDELQRTAQDLAYLAAKTMARGVLGVEDDLRLAETQWPHDPSWARLRRSYGQAAHLLAECDGPAAVRATLLSRLRQLPELAGFVGSAQERETLPHLAPLHPLPDLPHPALVRTLGHHRSAVRACAISADGRLVATAASDRHVRLWDARTGSLLRELVAREVGNVSGQWARALAFDPAAACLVAAAADRRLWIWDVSSGELCGQLVGHEDVVTGCAIAHDGRTLVSSSLDGSLKVWDLADGTLRRTLAREWTTKDQGWLAPSNEQGHWSGVQGCAVSADGRWAASASSDQTLILWDLASGQARRVLSGHTSGVNACDFSPDGRRLVSGGSDRTLRIWDCETGEHRALLAHRNVVTACRFSADGEYIVSASADVTVRLWSGDGDELVQTLTGHDDWVHDCSISTAAELIVSAANDGTARVWELNAPPEPYRMRQHDGWVMGCAAAARRGLLFTAGQDHRLVLWDVRRGQPRRNWRAHESSVRACAVSADDTLLASAAADGSIKVWDTTSTAPLNLLTGHREWVNAVAFHPDGSKLASVSNDRTLRLWDLRTRSRKLALVAHGHWVNSCSFSPGGRFVVTGAADGKLRHWPMDFEEALWEAWLAHPRPLSAERALTALRPLSVAAHDDSINACVHAPDGRFLVTASSDRSLKLWDGARLLRVLAGHLASVQGCAVSADGSRIASVATDGQVRVWDAADGRCVMSMQVDGALSGCAWTGVDDVLALTGSRGVYFLVCRP